MKHIDILIMVNEILDKDDYCNGLWNTSSFITLKHSKKRMSSDSSTIFFSVFIDDDDKELTILPVR
uniref:Uncharacterized protein n=1 Tax=Romanomermis culicivorax TaxID=13658 RepID=A0A915J830_ROMCU